MFCSSHAPLRILELSESPTISTEVHDSPLRVMAVGDCNTWGIAEPPVGNTILDKFCRQLDLYGLATASQNLGCGMATSREGITRMQLDAEPADVVLLNFGLVDTWMTTIPRIYILYYPDNFLRKRLRKLLKFVKRRLRNPRLRSFVPVGPVVTLDEYAENFRTMIALSRAKNPHATVLLWGSPPVQGDPARNANLQRYNQCLQSVARETGSAYVDTDILINQLPADSAYLDAVHLSETATQAIAEQLAHRFRAQQLSAAG